MTDASTTSVNVKHAVPLVVSQFDFTTQRGCATLHPLQFRPHPQDAADHPRDGGWTVRSCLELRGIRGSCTSILRLERIVDEIETMDRQPVWYRD